MSKTFKVWSLLGAILLAWCAMLFAEHKINKPEEKNGLIEREQQHLVAMEEGADPDIGVDTVPSDGRIDESFVSHLPLVVIDVSGKDIPITRMTTEDQQIVYTGENPYIYGSISVISNDTYVNRLSDEADFSSLIKIRYRGNYSLGFDKKQYGIKLVDEFGDSIKEPILGMDANNDWILNISQLDESLIRNYMAYNIGSALFENTTECQYCEVILKDQDSYTYQGVYLLMEKIEKGKGRVELEKYTPGNKTIEYLLCRDRENTMDVQLSTYGNESGFTHGRLSVLYPDSSCIDEKAFNYIQNDIDSIERILYSDNDYVFSSWPEYIDAESFVDYFIFNEYLGNYDAGDNSTYMYKKKNGKLCMGPLWDYDGAMDNGIDIANPEYLAFYESPWFERLVTSRKFMNMARKRYKELSKNGGLLSPDEMNQYIDDVSLFLGNAALRDRSRWEISYDFNDVHDVADDWGNTVSRDSSSWEEEVNRLKGYFVIKSLYMKDSLNKLYYETESDNTLSSVLAVAMIISFGCTVVLIRRRGTLK